MTGFYIRFVIITLSDIKSFLILLLVAFLMFGIPISLINMTRIYDYDENLEKYQKELTEF